MARSSMVSGHEWLIILQRSIPSFTLSYNVLPSRSIGNKDFRSESHDKCL